MDKRNYSEKDRKEKRKDDWEKEKDDIVDKTEWKKKEKG